MTMQVTLPRPSTTLTDPGYEARILDTARRALDDIPHCARADYTVRWFPGPTGSMPTLVVAFNIPETVHQPACAVCLASISQSTGALTLLKDDRLRAHLRKSIEAYLKACGVVLDKPDALLLGLQ